MLQTSELRSNTHFHTERNKDVHELMCSGKSFMCKQGGPLGEFALIVGKPCKYAVLSAWSQPHNHLDLELLLLNEGKEMLNSSEAGTSGFRYDERLCFIWGKLMISEWRHPTRTREGTGEKECGQKKDCQRQISHQKHDPRWVWEISMFFFSWLFCILLYILF